ncbi:MAG: hypothetical protein V1926_02600 [Candidatus Peregrinibacteria bacterium]
MRSCIAYRWDHEHDPDMEDVLPPSIVEALHFSEQDGRHALGMARALLAMSNLQERRRVLVEMMRFILLFKSRLTAKSIAF